LANIHFTSNFFSKEKTLTKKGLYPYGLPDFFHHVMDFCRMAYNTPAVAADMELVPQDLTLPKTELVMDQFVPAVMCLYRE